MQSSKDICKLNRESHQTHFEHYTIRQNLNHAIFGQDNVSYIQFWTRVTMGALQTELLVGNFLIIFLQNQ